MSTQQQEFSRTDSDFLSHGTRCSGWLYQPKGATSPPIVIMAHGFAAEKTFGLPAFAERFVKEGLAVFLFDYRCFGGSDGKTRNLVNPYLHVQDWKAAIDHVRTLPNINHSRIALWGTSFSGGHVIVAAARDSGISAIISQVPNVDSIDSCNEILKNNGWLYMMRCCLHACRDAFRMLTLRGPHYVPVLGDPGALAVLNTPDAMPGYLSIVPEGSTWKNECPARIMFTSMLYRPTALARKVKCPALVIMAEKDSLIPPSSVEKAASKMAKGRLVRMPVGHFDLYSGEGFEKAAEIQTHFLKEHLADAH